MRVLNLNFTSLHKGSKRKAVSEVIPWMPIREGIEGMDWKPNYQCLQYFVGYDGWGRTKNYDHLSNHPFNKNEKDFTRRKIAKRKYDEQLVDPFSSPPIYSKNLTGATL